MKKSLILFILLLGVIGFVKGQQVVFDPAVVSTLVANHTTQQAVLKDIKEKEGTIAMMQTAISLKVAEIKELETKMHNSLTRVDQIITQGRNVLYASNIAADIGQYQAQMVQLATGDPELMVVALKGELELINRTADMFEYILQASLGGDVNMMNSADRINMIRYVVDNLRVMRGMAYGIVRRMRTAKYAGVWATINPFNTRYIDNRVARAEALINDFKFKK